VFSKDGSHYVLTRSTLGQMPRSSVYSVDSTQAIAELGITAIEPRQAPAIELVAPEQAGGFNAAIVRPRLFDPKKKYPVLVYVYGGPGFSLVKSTMASYFTHQYFADHGFVVVSLDGRGTPRRGRAFERALKGAFGSVPLDDQVAGLEALGKKYPELDLSRVGIYGWSFGGYMAALAVLKRPDIFKVGVAGAPVADWLYYDTHYTERYLGVPESSEDAIYRGSSLIPLAKGLDRPLLLVHGIADDNVYFAHTLQLSDALFRAGKRPELLPLVRLTHQVADPAVRETLYQRMVKFLGATLW
jgi:dipeptidyl-peptidase 4